MSEFEMLVMTALACLGMGGMLVVGPAVVHLPSIRKKGTDGTLMHGDYPKNHKN